MLASLLRWDGAAFHLLYGWAARVPHSRQVFGAVTLMGDGRFVVLAALALLLGEWLAAKRKPVIAAEVFWTFTVSGILTDLIKLIVARPRPISLAAGSFPSGHTSDAFALATVLAAFYPGTAWIYWLLAAMVGLSRIALGAHYPLDVVAGAAIGFGVSHIWLKHRRRLAADHAHRDRGGGLG